MWFHCSSLTAVLCLCSDQTISISMKTIRMNECNRSHKAPLSIRIYVIFPIASESTIKRRKVNEDADLTLTLRCLLWRSLRDHAQHGKKKISVCSCLFYCFAWQMINGEFLHCAGRQRLVNRRLICRTGVARNASEALIIYHSQSLRVALRNELESPESFETIPSFFNSWWSSHSSRKQGEARPPRGTDWPHGNANALEKAADELCW